MLQSILYGNKLKLNQNKISAARSRINTGIDLGDQLENKQNMLLQKAAAFWDNKPQKVLNNRVNVEERLRNKDSKMKDILVYSDFANRLLNQTSDKNLNKIYMMYRKKHKRNEGLDFYKRMERDIKSWSNS